jgi:hypothetical protein
MMPWVAISGGYSCCKTVVVKGYKLAKVSVKPVDSNQSSESSESN